MSAEQTREIERSVEAQREDVTCAGPCGDVEPYERTVDVVAGHVTSDSGDTVSVQGVDGGAPIIQQWCAWCAEDQFSISRSRSRRMLDRVTYYVDSKTVAAFALGASLMLVISSIFIV